MANRLWKSIFRGQKQINSPVKVNDVKRFQHRPMTTDANILATVVRRVDSAVHWITQLVLLLFIRWIVIYPVDSVIHLLNNRGLLIT